MIISIMDIDQTTTKPRLKVNVTITLKFNDINTEFTGPYTNIKYEHYFPERSFLFNAVCLVNSVEDIKKCIQSNKEVRRFVRNFQLERRCEIGFEQECNISYLINNVDYVY